MRRTHLWAFLLACLPTLVVAQTAKDLGPAVEKATEKQTN